jgi:hypothetical protein
MKDERWRRMKEATWFRTEQDEVITYVEQLRNQQRILMTLLTLIRGIPMVEKLLAHLEKDQGNIPHADFGPDASTVEARASLLLRTLNGEIPTTPVDTADL